MNKSLRFTLATFVLVTVLALASSKIVWANTAASTPPKTGEVAPIELSTSLPGSVRAPNCDGITVYNKESKSLCGIVLLGGIEIGTSASAILKGALDGFISQTVAIFLKSGSVSICFAAPEGGQIYFLPQGEFDWTPFPTSLLNGLACAIVTDNGDYALGYMPKAPSMSEP